MSDTALHVLGYIFSLNLTHNSFLHSPNLCVFTWCFVFYEVFNLKLIPACGARVTLWKIYLSEIREYKFACSAPVEKKLVHIYSGYRF